MKLLITGGAGFIGSAFVRHVLSREDGADVVTLDKLTYAGNMENLASVRDNPRTSAMIAFNLGVWAGQATQKKLGRTDFSELPAKLIDMMPSMRELGDYVPSLPSPLKLSGQAPRRSGRKSSVKTAAKRAAPKRRAKRKTAGKTA